MQDLSLQDLLSLEPGADISRRQLDDRGAVPTRISRPRNRNPRSCDFCRARKTACIIEDALPCTTCRARGRHCTFMHRRRGNLQHGETPEGATGPGQNGW